MRKQLVKHIAGGDAFKGPGDFVEKIPFEKLGIKPDNMPYSLWQQFYHLRFAQRDILDFSTDPDYEAPKWPDDYWPEEAAPPTEAAWKELKKAFFEERKAFQELILDPSQDLFKPLAHGNGQTLYREALLVIEHNAYHTGQILVLLRLLGLYEK